MTRLRDDFSTARWLSLAALLPALAACDSSDGSTKDTGFTEIPGSEPSATGSPTDEPPPTAMPPMGGELAINVAANDTDVHSPFDATPSPDGATVYYLGLRSIEDETTPGIFKVPAAGGAIEALASGAPLGAPVGITVSLDGSTLFVADPGSGLDGAIVTVSTNGGAATALAGTAGYYPAGVVIAEVDDRETLYFTGTDPDTDERGLFSTSAGGGSVTVVASGSPFVDPGGVIVDRSGTAYVADSLASDGLSSVVRVQAGTASLFVEAIGVGFPAGITMTHDESTIVVSGLDPVSRTDLVYFVNVESRELSTLTDPVGAFHDSAGLHRAHDKNVFAWADRQANDTGTVYVLAQ